MPKTKRQPEPGAPKFLYGPNGEVLHRVGDKIDGEMSPNLKAAYQTFIQAIRAFGIDPIKKTEDAYSTHAYVYAAATAIALNISQVTLTLFRETAETEAARARESVRRGYCKHEGLWIPSRGVRRSIIRRTMHTKRRWLGRAIRGMEPDFQHPLNEVLDKPNPVMVGSSDLTYAIALFLSLRGECFILPKTASGAPWLPGVGEPPVQLVTLHPDNMRERLGTNNELLWWEYTPTSKDAGNPMSTGMIKLMPNEVIHFKYFNPGYPVRGMSRITAAALGIHQDLSAQSYNSALMKNNAEPAGILVSQKSIRREEDREEILRKWEDRHRGPMNQGRTAVLEGGLSYIQTALSPRDMQFLEQRKWNREEILAVMGVPKSILSVDENLNYSIQLSQDKNFWNKCLIPIIRIIEAVFDSTLMFGEPDTLSLGYDLTPVEALQEDVTGKVDTAIKLMTQGRVTQKDAFDKVGLDIEEQEFSDVILVTGSPTPLEQIVNGTEPGGPNDPNAQDPNDPNNPDFQDLPPGGEPADPAPEANDNGPNDTGKRVKRVKLRNPLARLSTNPVSKFFVIRGISPVTWSEKARKNKAITASSYRRALAPGEKVLRLKWGSWITQLRRDQLNKFDEYLREHGLEPKSCAAIKLNEVLRAGPIPPGDIEKFLFNNEQAKKELRSKFRKEYDKIADSAVELTKSELGGVYVFDIDSEAAHTFMEQKLVKVTNVSDTVRDRIRRQVVIGIDKAETVGDIRGRIQRVFNNQLSAGRATTIARTEVAQTFGGIRDIMFTDEGIEKTEWTTAGDEHVRDDHVTLGGLGPKKRGYNYMNALGGDGVLEYPSDSNGPAEQVINCRCVAVATG